MLIAQGRKCKCGSEYVWYPQREPEIARELCPDCRKEQAKTEPEGFRVGE